jgi:hypothetical protein
MMNQLLIKTLTLVTMILLQAGTAPWAQAGGFRCGTRLVVTGDTVSRLIDACGQPVMKYKAKESVRQDGSRRTTGVTNWVYERGRRDPMIVSVRSGRVVRIATDR